VPEEPEAPEEPEGTDANCHAERSEASLWRSFWQPCQGFFAPLRSPLYCTLAPAAVPGGVARSGLRRGRRFKRIADYKYRAATLLQPSSPADGSRVDA